MLADLASKSVQTLVPPMAQKLDAMKVLALFYLGGKLALM